MSVSAVSVSGVSAVQPIVSGTAAKTGETSSIGPATVTRISKQGDLLSRLRDLQDSDPEQFQATMKEMAGKLRAEAKESSGDKAKALNDLADKVTEAAETGDLSVLKPPSGGRGGRPPGGPGGPPPGGAPPGGVAAAEEDASSTSSSSASTSPADANGDGTVTDAEQAAYDLLHPSGA